MSSNPFALLDVDGQEKPKAQPKQQVKKAAPAAAKTAAAPKKDAKAAPQQKKPLASGERDRHTKGGRSEGEKANRPYDRSLNRQTKGQTERKGQDKQVKGGWAAKNPEADQVAADVDQKKDEEVKKEEEKKEEEKKEEEKKPEEPAPFLLADAMKAKQKVAGERTKVRAATAAATSASINAGSKPIQSVASIKKGQSQINVNKKTFNIDEFLTVSGGAAKVNQQEERHYKKRPQRTEFPSL